MKKFRSKRQRKKQSAKEVGTQCGIAEAALRNYENGNRQPDEEKLQKIADTLEVNVAALHDRKIDSITDVMHILFEIERIGYIQPERFQVNPNHSRTEYGVRATSEMLNEAIQKWAEKRSQWVDEQIKDDEYFNWQDAFPAECEVEVREKATYPAAMYDSRDLGLNALFHLRMMFLSEDDLLEGPMQKENAKNSLFLYRRLKKIC